ncbi:DcaP family trimeric outer membrane transporter [Sessilibacter sp. MAH2]
MSFSNRTWLCLPAILFSCSAVLNSAQAAVELVSVETSAGTAKVSFGGYTKVDVRHVNGDIAYQDYWVANFPGGAPRETSRTGFNVRESRINFKVEHPDVSAFVEFDLYGGGGNEVVSNSSNPRLRHFYLTYKNWLAGQTWTTFMPLQALPESLDFGGPHVGEAFVRQVQVRYTTGPWQFAIENPETNGDGDVGTPASAVGLSGDEADPDEANPDVVARYNYNNSWGTFSASTLLRQVDQGGLDDFAVALNVAGKIKTFGKDDFRFQITTGDPGRYVGAGLTPDVVVDPDTGRNEVESTDAFAVAYRHFWTDIARSTVYYGQAETDVLGRERAHWAVNYITNLTPKLSVGAELGNYSIDDEGIDGIDSDYLQFSAKFDF